MPTVTELLRRHLLAGVPDRAPSLESLMRTERSPEFERLRLNRKVLGAMRYGLFEDLPGAKRNYVAAMEKCLAAYRKDGNGEHLVDLANFAETEYVRSGAVVHATDDVDHVTE